MAQTFDPVLVSRIFLALTYFRTWVVLFLFPIVVLSPDIALNFIKKLYFPTPVDILCYNESDFKESQKQIQIQQMREVVDPFNDENINIKALSSLREAKDKDLGKDNYTVNFKNQELKTVSPSNYKENELKMKSSKNKGASESELIMKKNNNNFTEPNELIEKIQKENRGNSKGKTPIDKKKDSVFVDGDFEMMEGKYIDFY